jgi:hypothetical protein
MKTSGIPAMPALVAWAARVGLCCVVASPCLVQTALAQSDATDGEAPTEAPAEAPEEGAVEETSPDESSYDASGDDPYASSSGPSASDDYAESEEAEEESSFTVNAMMKMQGGLFLPGPSDKFKEHHNVGYRKSEFGYDMSSPCDQVQGPNQGTQGCYATDHGKKAGSPSIARATLQIEAHWDFTSKYALHMIFRGVRSARLAADEYAQVPNPPDDPALRHDYAKNWVQDNYYNRVDLREFYLDALPLHWLTFRIGRQQVAWGETGQFRLLDVVNPIDSTWRFGALESFEDQRIPLWMALMTLDVPKLAGALESLWIPGIDKDRDIVSPPLSMSGAWGVPYSNVPGLYRIRNKDFRYPNSKDLSDSRVGFRWKADLGEHASYSLVYMYTHMQTPVLTGIELTPEAGGFSTDTADRAVLKFPRQHVAGLSAEYTFDSPLGLTARFEGAVEPNRSYSQRTDTSGDSGSKPGQILYTPTKNVVVSYAAVIQRPTMIRFLNPTQNFLLVAQFMHTAVPTLDLHGKDVDAVEVVGYNDWRAQKHSYRVIGYATTTYFNGFFTPKLTGAWIINPYYKDSGFYSLDLGFRIGPHYRVNVTATDFIGKNAYRDLGLFRDRDELHASFTTLF